MKYDIILRIYLQRSIAHMRHTCRMRSLDEGVLEGERGERGREFRGLKLRYEN